MTAEELLKVFYSGHQARADWENLDELEVATTTEVIEVTKFVLASRQEYEKAQDKIDDFKEAYRVTGHGSEEKGHFVLKLLAENYVKKQGLEPVIDQEVRGLYPDLFAKDFSLIVECGSTSASKVRQYFTQLPQLTRLVILPYPFAEQTKLYGFEFTKGKNFDSFIEDHTDTLRQAVLKARSKK